MTTVAQIKLIRRGLEYELNIKKAEQRSRLMQSTEMCVWWDECVEYRKEKRKREFRNMPGMKPMLDVIRKGRL